VLRPTPLLLLLLLLARRRRVCWLVGWWGVQWGARGLVHRAGFREEASQRGSCLLLLLLPLLLAKLLLLLLRRRRCRMVKRVLPLLHVDTCSMIGTNASVRYSPVVENLL
jgi:hypothetical protein